ncbi:hypothetical protein SPLC1_S230680 [Arthrospira platensis C1]|nr:hypothetical protein SPLC1_S230680 [Arthrospira platensis C1]
MFGFLAIGTNNPMSKGYCWAIASQGRHGVDFVNYLAMMGLPSDL